MQHLLEKNVILLQTVQNCVNQGKPSFEDAHTVNVYVCMCVYVYLLLQMNSFLANLCSIPPRKCKHESTADSIDDAIMLEKMVVLLQQSVLPIYAIWPNMAKKTLSQSPALFFLPTAGPHFTDDVTLRLVSSSEPGPVLP